MASLWRSIGWRRLLVTVACLAVWRAFTNVQVAYVSPGLFSMMPLPGSYSVVALGLQPLVNALVAVTLARAMSTRLRAMTAAPEGRQRLARWTRVLTAGIASAQAYSLTVLLQTDSLVPPLGWFPRAALVLQLVAGTMTLVLLGDLMDEWGLGFGNGALMIYTLGPVVLQTARLRDLLTIALSGDSSVYRALLAWAAASILLVIASVAALHAFRAVQLVEAKRLRAVVPMRLPLLLSGVLRPPAFAGVVISLPYIYSQFLSESNRGIQLWLQDNWSPYAVNVWGATAYLALASLLVIGFAHVVVRGEFDPAFVTESLRRSRLTLAEASSRDVTVQKLQSTALRLAFLGGCFLALATVVVPVPVFFITRALGHALLLSGTEVVLVAALVLAAAAGVESPRGDGRSELSPQPLVI